MPEAKQKHRSDASGPEKPSKKHTVRNFLLILLLLIGGSAYFIFGINKWRIEFALKGDSTVTSECGIPYRDEGADAEVTGSILKFVHHPIPVKVSTEGVNIHEPGTYTVTYTSKFLWLSSTNTRTVVIVDTTPPVIELAHIDDYYTLPHHAYKEEGYTATDNHDGDITHKVQSEERDGVVYYTVTDASGNTATTEREIFYDDRNAPVFHFENGEEGFLFQGETWKDSVTAEDDADGDVTARITSTSNVDPSKVGTYTVTYTVSDEWGNVATKERYVTVKRRPIGADEAAASAVIDPEAAAKAAAAAKKGQKSDTAQTSPEKTKKPAKADPDKIIYLTFDDGPGQYTEELLDILAKHGRVTAEGLAESALRNVALLEKYEFEDIVISLKSSDVQMNYDAYRIVDEQSDYPLHIGVTEAGTPSRGKIKSAAGVGALLLAGIGDTLRISLTADPVEEVYFARELLAAIGMRSNGPNVVSCPTCGRTEVDLEKIATEVERRLADLYRTEQRAGQTGGQSVGSSVGDLTIAVMGCAVNGPGEAKGADFGVACGKGEGLLFAKGEIIKKVKEDEIVDELLKLIQ